MSLIFTEYFDWNESSKNHLTSTNTCTLYFTTVKVPV